MKHCRFSRLTWKGGKPPKQRLKVGDTVVLPRNPPLWQRSFVWQSFQHQDLKSLKQISKNAMSPITTKTPYLARCIGCKVCRLFRLILLWLHTNKTIKQGTSEAWFGSSADQSCFETSWTPPWYCWPRIFQTMDPQYLHSCSPAWYADV